MISFKQWLLKEQDNGSLEKLEKELGEVGARLSTAASALETKRKERAQKTITRQPYQGPKDPGDELTKAVEKLKPDEKESLLGILKHIK